MPLTGDAKTEAQRRRRARKRQAQAAQGRQGVTGASGRQGPHGASRQSVRDARMAKIAAEETEGLSPREVAAANALLSGATRSDAARAGGYSPTSGALRKGGPIMSAVQRALHRNGAYRRSHEVVRETLDATTTKFFPTLGRVERTCTCQECGEEFTPAATTVACPSCGSVKWTVKEHTEIPSREVVAHGERRLAAELVYRLTGDLAAGEEIPAKILGPVSVEVFVAQATPVPRNGGGIQVVTVQTGHNGGAN